MFLEIVKFGNGVAIEVRGMGTRLTVYYMLTCALSSAGLVTLEQLPDPPVEPIQGNEMNLFEERCFQIIDDAVNKKLRWLMLCTDVNILSEDATEEFNRCHVKAFNRESPLAEDPDVSRAEVMVEVGVTMQERVWMVDRQTKRVFCVHFNFASPIYRTTLLAGVMLRHKSFEAQYRREEPDTLQPIPKLQGQEGQTDRERMLTRLRELLPKEIDENTSTGVLESTEVEVTEFIVKDAKMWCGDSCFKGQWLAQQLNVWFNTPQTEKCWFRPSNEDAFSVTVGVWDELTTPDTTHDAERWLALPAPSPQNTMWRYPHGNVLCGTPKGILGVGHFLPQFNEDMERWTTAHSPQEVRMFRLYKTQYPYVYSLMPDDDQQVRALKSKLKRSTESNPSLAEKGKEDVKERIKTSTDGGTVKKFTPLIATIPTLEAERYVKAVFQENPKYRYRLWWCARYNNNSNSQSIWVPVSPIE